MEELGGAPARCAAACRRPNRTKLHIMPLVSRHCLPSVLVLHHALNRERGYKGVRR